MVSLQQKNDAVTPPQITSRYLTQRDRVMELCNGPVRVVLAGKRGKAATCIPARSRRGGVDVFR